MSKSKRSMVFVEGQLSKGAKHVPLGDVGELTDYLPSAFTATVEYRGESDLVVEIDATFDGDRVSVDRVQVRPPKGRSLQAQDMAHLQLARVVRDASQAMCSIGNGAHVGRRFGLKPTPDELALVAAVYWFEYATWGSPRAAIMGYWDLPRSTANYWIRKARELYRLPGAHAEDGE